MGKKKPRLFVADPDFRRNPETSRYCWHCQRDIRSGVFSVIYVTKELFTIVHPDDRNMVYCERQLIGAGCRKHIPKEFLSKP